MGYKPESESLMINRCIAVTVIVVGLWTVAHGVDSPPKRVFLRARSCDEQLSSDIIASLRQEIRASAGYQLATSLSDSGGYEVVITVYATCVEAVLPTNREHVASIAVIFGTGACTMGSCTVQSNESTLDAVLCSGRQAQVCGRNLYTSLDGYMSKGGGFIFDDLSRARIKVLREMESHP